jgi:hypothetical protein
MSLCYRPSHIPLLPTISCPFVAVHFMSLCCRSSHIPLLLSISYPFVAVHLMSLCCRQSHIPLLSSISYPFVIDHLMSLCYRPSYIPLLPSISCPFVAIHFMSLCCRQSHNPLLSSTSYPFVPSISWPFVAVHLMSLCFRPSHVPLLPSISCPFVAVHVMPHSLHRLWYSGFSDVTNMKTETHHSYRVAWAYKKWNDGFLNIGKTYCKTHVSSPVMTQHKMSSCLSKSSWQILTLLCFISSVSSFGTVYAHTFLMSRSLVTVFQTVPLSMFTSSVMILTFSRRYSRTIWRIFYVSFSSACCWSSWSLLVSDAPSSLTKTFHPL